MVDKCSSPYSRMTVFDCLKPSALSAVGNDDRMLRNKFFVVCKCPGGRTLLTAKCPAPGTHRASNTRGLPGGDARGWNWLAHYCCCCDNNNNSNNNDLTNAYININNNNNDLTNTLTLSFWRFFLFFWAFINILTGTLDDSLSLFALFVIRLVTLSNLLTLLWTLHNSITETCMTSTIL